TPNTPPAHNPSRPINSIPPAMPPPISHFRFDDGFPTGGRRSQTVSSQRGPMDLLLLPVSVPARESNRPANSAVVGRPLGSLRRQARHTSSSSAGTSGHSSRSGRSRIVLTRSSVSRTLSPQKGSSPPRQRYRITPRAQTSAGGPTSFVLPAACSG